MEICGGCLLPIKSFSGISGAAANFCGCDFVSPTALEPTISQLQKEIKDWADEVFPNRTAHSALTKLMLEEIPEFSLAQHEPGEYADLVILLFDIASLNDIDIAKAVSDKMTINRNRDWEVNPGTGIMHHIRENSNAD